MIREHDSAVLTVDLPAQGLRRGDVGTVVMVHGGARGFEVEFVTLGGTTPSGAGPTARAPRVIQSRLRSWLDSTTPVTGRPS